VLRTRPLVIGALILLCLSPAAESARAPEFEPLEALETGEAVLEINGLQILIPYSITVAGPRVALEPLVARLGGTLERGPLGQRHELDINDTVFVFGPGSGALTSGESIQRLSQPPAVGEGGLHVPLDLLHWIYTRLAGFEFSWSPGARKLVVERQPARDIPVTFDVVSLQGVTTVVFEFPMRPRYRIERSPSRIAVELIGDRLDLLTPRRFPSDRNIRDVRVTPDRIVIDLAPRTTAQDYSLERPFRLVFDVLQGAAPTLPESVVPQPRERRNGLETIVIDPGHGGRDTGAVGPAGTEEKALTLLIARSLARRLEESLRVRTVLTRNDDSEIPPDGRSALANQYKGDLFLSIHLNSSPSRASRGAETFFLSLEASDEEAEKTAEFENQAGGGGDPLYDLQLILWDLAQTRYMTASHNLASLVQDELNSALGLRNRGVKQAPFRVLVGAAMPAVLVELGFISNAEEELLLLDASYRAQLVEALVRAVTRYAATGETTVKPVTTDGDLEAP
jgi:N-acetylmuramoyl-L-alanine amidase